MTASVKTAKSGLPSALNLLQDALVTVWNFRVAVYGYTAWLLVPIIIYVFAQNVPSPYGNYLLLLQNVLALVLGLWVTAVIMLYVSVAITKSQDEEVDYGAISKRGWEKILNLFVIQVFTGCLVLFGTILFALPGIIAWVWTAFAIQEGVLSNGGIGDAFKASRALVRGRFMAILGRLLLVDGLFVVFLVLALAAYLLIGLHGSTAEVIPTLYAWPHWLEVGFSLMVLPITPISITFHLLLYFAAKKSYPAANV